MARLIVHAPLALLLATSLGCKKKEEAPSNKEAKSEAQPKSEPAAAPIDAAPAAAAPLVLSEEPVILFKAPSGESATVAWTIAESKVSIRAEQRSDLDTGTHTIAVLATVGEEAETPIASCEAWKPGQEGYIDLMQRADTVHIRCVTPGVGDAPGETTAERLRFDTATKSLAKAGSYSGEGLVDPDTIDLDEGE